MLLANAPLQDGGSNFLARHSERTRGIPRLIRKKNYILKYVTDRFAFVTLNTPLENIQHVPRGVNIRTGGNKKCPLNKITRGKGRYLGGEFCGGCY